MKNPVFPRDVRPTIDPFSRPAEEVTTEEWRILICSLAGRLRVSQGATTTVPIPAASVPTLIATNDKSFALFVSIRQLAGFSYFIGGDISSANANSGITVGVGALAEQVLLPGERLYAASAAGGNLVVTQLTV